MKLLVKNRKGEITELEVKLDTFIKDLKAQIFQKNATTIDQQHLIFDCITLKDEQTLKDYCIQDNSIILLIENNNSLLLESSKIFVDSTLIDHIHQSLIDLENQPPKEDVMNLLIEAISYLDEKLDLNTAKELISLILACFTNYPEESFKIFQIRYQKPNISSFHIIVLSYILSNFVLNKRQISIGSYEDFISNSIKEILPQVQNNNANITVNGLEIIPEFKTKFITNLVLVSKLTEQIVTVLYSFFSLKEVDLSIINAFIQKVHDDRLLSFIPESYFLNNDLYLQLSHENMMNFVSNISQPNFKQILKSIETFIQNSSEPSKYVNIFIHKCIEFDIVPKSLSTMINFYDDFKSVSFWKYISKNSLRFTNQEFIVSKIEKEGVPIMECYPKTGYMLKCVSNPESLPQEFLSYALLNAEVLSIYFYVFQTKIKSKVFSTFEFWNHILTLASKEKCTDLLITRFIDYFTSVFDAKQSVPFIDRLIFDNFPLNTNQSSFLQSFIQKLPKRYIFEFHSFAHDKELDAKLIKQTKIPPPLCIGLFNLHYIFTNKDDKVTPFILYLYAFSNCKPDFITELNIMEKTHERNEVLIDFISQKNNFDLIANIDEESLSLIACSLYFARTEKIIPVKGLTVENILPFYSILMNYSDSNVYRTSKEMLDLLIESCDYLENNDSPLLIASLNSIFSNMKTFNSKSMWSIKVSLFVDRFINSLLNGKYKGDKIILIEAIFKLSMKEDKSTIFKSKGNEIINYIIQNISEIINSKSQFNNIFLNLNAFCNNGIQMLIDIIQNSTSYEPIYQMIYFIIKLTQNFVGLNNDYNVKTALQKAIYDENWDEVTVIMEFMNKFNIKINKDYFKAKRMPPNVFKILNNDSLSLLMNDIDETVTFCMHDTQIEKNDYYLQLLFKYLIQNEFFATKYIAICLEKITVNQVFSPEVFLNKFSFLNSYTRSTKKLNMVDTIKHYYRYSKEKNIFIRKIDVSPMKVPEPDFQFLSKLVDQKSFQSFVCLNNIAASFPFLFEPFANENDSSHSLVAVNIVLPFLNSVHKMFDDQITPQILDELKTAFAALSFLFSCLYSTRFLSIFTQWIFENLTKLSESQIFCFLHVLLSLFKTKGVDRLVFAYAVKYNFFDILANIMNRKILNVLFQRFYDSIICEISFEYHFLFSTIKNKGNALFIQQIKEDKIQNPFENSFNNFLTISPIILKPLDFTLFDENNLQLKQLFNFFKEVNTSKSYWISYDMKKNDNYNFGWGNSWSKTASEKVSTSDMRNFLTAFTNEVHFAENEEPISIPKKINSEMHKLLLSKPSWALNFIENQYGSEILSKVTNYRIYLTGLSMEISKCNQEAGKGKKKDSITKSIDGLKIFSENVYCNSFFEAILNKISNSYDYDNDENLMKLINKFNSGGNNFLIALIHYTSKYISGDQISSQKLRVLCLFLSKFWKKNESIEKCFIGECADKIVNVAVSNLCRMNEELLENICYILVSLKSDLPIRVTHIIGLIFAYHPNLIPLGTELYLKMGDKYSSSIFPVIQMRYKKDVKAENLDLGRIKNCIDNFPTLAKSCLSESSILLNRVIIQYKQENFINSTLQDIIIELFNMAAPPPIKTLNNSNSVPVNDDVNNDDLLCPVPEYIKQTSPIFWEDFYEKNRPFLIEIIEKNRKIFNSLYFLFDYIEISSFKLRYMYFRKKMDEMVKLSYSSFTMRISRSRVLLDTFGYWCSKERKKFLLPFRITFNNEDGYDQGGLTREWLTYLVKELFDPKLGLFLKNEKQNYYFNPSTYLNFLNVECLKMAGGIIALSLIKDINVKVHLSKPLLRILLHQEIQLDDIKDFDESLFISFHSILDSKDLKPLDLVFSIDEMRNNKLVSVNLIENGDKIGVTNENKNDYVKLYLNHKLKNSVIEQINAFVEGFESLIDFKYIKFFSPKELDLIIYGNDIINVNDMKKHVQYEGVYNPDHPVIVMFFNVISNWSQENLSKLLLFITGSTQVGVNGFEGLKLSGSPITISPIKGKDRFPIAHTCSNQLELPEYDDEKDMNEKLLLAIQESQFAID